MEYAIISGDIVASTSLSISGKKMVENAFANLISDLDKIFKVYGRIIKGDYIECFIPDVSSALRVMLAIKTYIKSIDIDENGSGFVEKKRAKLFKTFGIRLAIGIGELTRLDLKNGIIDGEAIYMSGRVINEFKTSDKQKVSIKNTLFIKSKNHEFDSQIDTILSLIDVILSKSTSKQCQVLYYKLIGLNEKQLVEKLRIKQSTINQHSTSVGWQAIEKAVLYFEHILQSKSQVIAKIL
jgi:hypothetical protein